MKAAALRAESLTKFSRVFTTAIRVRGSNSPSIALIIHILLSGESTDIRSIGLHKHFFHQDGSKRPHFLNACNHDIVHQATINSAWYCSATECYIPCHKSSRVQLCLERV